MHAGVILLECGRDLERGQARRTDLQRQRFAVLELLDLAAQGAQLAPQHGVERLAFLGHVARDDQGQAARAKVQNQHVDAAVLCLRGQGEAALVDLVVHRTPSIFRQLTGGGLGRELGVDFGDDAATALRRWRDGRAAPAGIEVNGLAIDLDRAIRSDVDGFPGNGRFSVRQTLAADLCITRWD